MSKKGIELNALVKALNAFAPLARAGAWDNVGLLLAPSASTSTSPTCVIKRMLITNDLTAAVLDEAVESEADFIYSYHPPLFHATKRLGHDATARDKLLVRCVEQRIAVYSPHTALDALVGGVNDWLAQVAVAGGDSDAMARVRTLEPSGAAVAHDAELDEDDPVPGMGRLVTLRDECSLTHLIERVKRATGCHHVRVAVGDGVARDHPMVQRVAVCAGSGMSMLGALGVADAHVLVTGEASHHELLAATAKGQSVILTEHSNSERPFLRQWLQPSFAKLFPTLSVELSKCDADPIHFV